MGSRRHIDAKLSHGRGKHFSTPTRQPSRRSTKSSFNEELSAFTSRVVRAENASAKHLNRICGGNVKKHEPAATLKPTSSTLSSRMHHAGKNSPQREQTSARSDNAVEHIVLHRIYYSVRNGSDIKDVSLIIPAEECSLGGNSEHCHENVESRGREEEYFDGNNSYESKQGQDSNEPAMTRTDARETTTQDMHSSVTKEYKRPSQKAHSTCRTVLPHEDESTMREDNASPLRHRSVPCSDYQMHSLSRANMGDVEQSKSHDTSRVSPEISLSTERFQAKVQQQQDATNSPRSGPHWSSYSGDTSAVRKQTNGLLCPSGKHSVATVHCTANGVGSSRYEMSSSTSVSKWGLTRQRDRNFMKLRDTVEKTQMENAGCRATEDQMPVRIAQDGILSKNAGNCQTQKEIAESNNDRGEIMSTVCEEQSLSVQTRPESYASTSPVAGKTPPTTMNAGSSLNFSRKASKRTRHSLGDGGYEDDKRPAKYVKQGSISEHTANGTTEKAFPADSRTELHQAQVATNSVQSGWIEREIVVVGNSSLWRSESENRGDGESESLGDTSSQRGTVEEVVGHVTDWKAELALTSPDAAVCRLRYSNMKRTESAYHAGELREVSPRRSTQRDGCIGRGKLHRSSHRQISHQGTHNALYSDYSIASQPSDGLSANSRPSSMGLTSSEPDVCELPASIFKPQAQIMQQDRNATLRVYKALFHPFSCSQSYITTSHQSRTNACQEFGDNISNGRATELSGSCSATQDSQGSQKSISMAERSSQDSSREHQIVPPCSPTAHADSGDQDIQILFVRSLQNPDPNVQQNVQTACNELPADSADEISTGKEVTIGNIKGVVEDVLSCSKNSIDEIQESSLVSDQSYSETSPPSCSKNNSRNGASLGQKEPYQVISKVVIEANHFVCPWLHCDRRFKRKDELTRHWRKHTGEKPYVCPLCCISFGRRDRQLCHMRTVHNV